MSEQPNKSRRKSGSKKTSQAQIEPQQPSPVTTIGSTRPTNDLLDQRQTKAEIRGQQIRDARIRKGLTQVAAANRLHIQVRSLQRWESGQIQPSIEYLDDMAKLYGVSVGDLL